MRRGKRRGFTLLELLTVMAIAAMMATVAVTSYFGAVRGMARKSALSHLVNTLSLARQRACMEGSRMCVILYNEILDNENPPSTAPSFVVCKEIGRISYADSTYLGDEFSGLDTTFTTVGDTDDLSQSYDTLKLYNLSQGKWTYVYPKVTQITGFNFDGRKDNDDPRTYSNVPVYGFKQSQVAKSLQSKEGRATLSFGQWYIGDSYGVEATPPTTLPKRFAFDQMQESNYANVLFVTFNPDGSVPKSESFTIIDSTDHKRTNVQVSSQGRISYNGKWN